MAIREYIKSCTNQGDEVGKIIDKDSKVVLITIVFFLIAIFALLFYAFNYM